MTQIEQWIREEGRVEGWLEGQEEVAKNMLLDGMEPARVAKYTNLGLATVEKIKQTLARKN